MGNTFSTVSAQLNSRKKELLTLIVLSPKRKTMRVRRKHKYNSLSQYHGFAFFCLLAFRDKGGITPLHAGYHGNILMEKKQENCRSLSLLYVTIVICMQRCNSSLKEVLHLCMQELCMQVTMVTYKRERDGQFSYFFPTYMLPW